MKHLTYVFALAFLITALGCKNTATTEETTQENSTATERQVAQLLDERILSNDWENEIQLNGTDKWAANEETTEGVRKMRYILNHTEIGPKMNFNELGNQLKSEINVIIKECSMKGASHDNLHVFLMPLIEKVDALREETDMEKNKALFTSIFFNLEAYDTYFK